MTVTKNENFFNNFFQGYTNKLVDYQNINPACHNLGNIPPAFKPNTVLSVAVTAINAVVTGTECLYSMDVLFNLNNINHG